jgi:hypothetical protein
MRDGLTAAALLTLSNTFMTMAWYGHLRFKTAPLLLVIVASWGIAFFEYLAQVPANRIGYRVLSGYQLKVIRKPSRWWCSWSSRRSGSVKASRYATCWPSPSSSAP